MTILYSSNLNDIELTEPQLTRWCSRYRGVRESLKTNTEADQLLYDIRFLDAGIEAQAAKVASDWATVETGGAVAAFYVWTDATPTLDPIVLEGLLNVAARLEKLRQRVKFLETK